MEDDVFQELKEKVDERTWWSRGYSVGQQHEEE
jgi:hypothetical protein